MFTCTRCDNYEDYTGYFYCRDCAEHEYGDGQVEITCPECGADELGEYKYAGNFSGLDKVQAWTDGMSNTQQTALF